MKNLVLWAVLAALVAPAIAQENDLVRIEHHFYWRKSVDQKYQGAIYGSQAGVWRLAPSTVIAGGQDVDAHYWIVAQSSRDLTPFEKPIDAEHSATFTLGPDGSMSHFVGAGVPYYRNYPAAPPEGAGPGSVWVGNGELVSDFTSDGRTTRIPILIEYRWDKLGDYFGTPVIQVKAQYALRYRQGMDPEGDPNLLRAEGTHIAVISYDSTTRKPVYLTETTKETFTKKDRIVTLEGRIWSTFNGVPALKKAEVTQSLMQQLQQAQVPDIKVEPDKQGVKLTLENLRFVADKAVLLPGETNRLQHIADLLRTVPDRSFLVVGHTAAIGTEESQVALSWDRALAIVEALKGQGIEARRLLYEGRGGTQPVADNTSDAGRALNRRVEIIVLDQ